MFLHCNGSHPTAAVERKTAAKGVRPASLVGEGWASDGVAGDALEWGCR